MNARPEESATPPRRRSRIWLWLGVPLGLLLLLVVAGPFLAAPFVRGKLVDLARERTGGEASLDTLSFHVGGAVRVAGLSVTDARRRPVAALEEFDVKLSPLAALRGRIEGRVNLDDFALHVWREADGSWSFEDWAGDADSGAGTESGGPGAEEPEVEEESEPKKLPELALDVAIRRGELYVHDARGQSTLMRIEADLRLHDGESHPSRVFLAFEGPQGPGGEIELDADVALEDGVPTVDGTLRLLGVALDAIGPALNAALDPEGQGEEWRLHLSDGVARGLVIGEVDWGFGAGPAADAPRAVGKMELQNLFLGRLAQDREPLVLESASLELDVRKDEQGRDLKNALLSVGDFLSARLDGRTVLSEAAGGTQSGDVGADLELTFDFGRALPTLAALAPMKEGLELWGELKGKGRLDLRVEENAPQRANLVFDARVPEFAARQGGGKRLDLGDLNDMTLSVEGAFDAAAGSAELKRLTVDAGPLQVSGRGRAAGFVEGFTPESLVVEDTQLTATADLDGVGRIVGALSDAPLDLGGRFELTTTARQADAAVRVETRGGLSGATVTKVVDGVSERVGPIDITLVEDATIALEEGGVSRLERLDVTSPALADLNLHAEGAITDLLRFDRASGELRQELRANLGSPAFARTGLLRDLQLGGGEIEQVARVTLEGGAFVNVVEVRSTELDVLLPPDPEDEASANGSDGEPRRMTFEPWRFDLAAKGDVSGKDIELAPWTLDAGWLQANGAGRLLSSEDGASGGMSLSGEGQIVTERLTPILGAYLGGGRIGGEPLALSFTVRPDAQGDSVTEAMFTGNRLRIQLPPKEDADDPNAWRTVDQRDLSLEARLASRGEDEAQRLEVEKLELQSSTARVEVTGRVGAGTDLRVTLDSRLEDIVRDVGQLAGLADTRASGAVKLETRLSGDETLAVNGDATITDLAWEQDDRRLSEARMALDWKLAMTQASEEEKALEIERFGVTSETIQGALQGAVRGLGDSTDPRLEDLSGEFRYVPDRLGALLAPWLPGKLEGAKEETLAFEFDGELKKGDSLALLRALQGSADVGLGRFLLPGFETGGDLGLQMKGDSLVATGDLGANGGGLDFEASLDLRETAPDARSRLLVRLSEVRSSPELAPLLSKLHPAFAAADAGQLGSLAGILDGVFELEYAAPLDAEQLKQGWKALPKRPIQGRGELRIDGASIAASPFLGKAFELFGEEMKDLELRPIRFQIENGRLTYDEPWQWTVSGSKTNFLGSIGLDGDLALDWRVPVTEKLAKKHKLLKGLVGQDLRLPIGGTVTRPKLDLQSAIVSAALGQGTGGNLGTVGEILGLGDGGGDGGTAGEAGAKTSPKKTSEQQAQELLDQADALWKAGKNMEAAPLYRRIRDEFKLTAVYLFNKKRIKDRRDGVE